MVERRRLGFLLALGGGGLSARAGAGRRRGHFAPQQPQRLGAGLLEVDARVREDLGRDALLLAQQPQQQVLGADVAVVQLARLAHRQLENFLGARGVRQIGPRRRGGFALLDRLLDLLLDLFEVDVEVGEDRGRHAFALADQAEQYVLGPHVLVVQPRGLFPRHLQDFPHPIREVVAVHLESSVVNRLRFPTSGERSSHAPAAARDRPGSVPPAPPGGPAACRSGACSVCIHSAQGSDSGRPLTARR